MNRLPWLAVLAVVLLVASRHEATQPVVVPYYGATYGPAGLSAGDGKRIVELLESIDGRLAAIEAKTAGPVGPKKGPELSAVARNYCSTCHTPARAEAKGGGFILFADDQAGALKPLSARERVRIAEAVQSGAMPPGPRKPSADEKAAFKW